MGGPNGVRGWTEGPFAPKEAILPGFILLRIRGWKALTDI